MIARFIINFLVHVLPYISESMKANISYTMNIEEMPIYLSVYALKWEVTTAHYLNYADKLLLAKILNCWSCEQIYVAFSKALFFLNACYLGLASQVLP
jgi:hypothetical protein